MEVSPFFLLIILHISQVLHVLIEKISYRLPLPAHDLTLEIIKKFFPLTLQLVHSLEKLVFLPRIEVNLRLQLLNLLLQLLSLQHTSLIILRPLPQLHFAPKQIESNQLDFLLKLQYFLLLERFFLKMLIKLNFLLTDFQAFLIRLISHIIREIAHVLQLSVFLLLRRLRSLRLELLMVVVEMSKEVMLVLAERRHVQ